MEKFLKFLLIFIAIGLWTCFFLIKDLGGDSGNVFWRIGLTKMHLSHQFAMPYFTPVHCGGFHLAADAQDLIFTIYMLFGFLIPNTVWAVKIANFFLCGIFFTGMYQWLKYFAVSHRLSRIFISLIMTVSGYWISHMVQGGHLWAHGLAYVPWIMILIEKLFSLPFITPRIYFIRLMWLLSGLLFLLINSGYYWLQVAFPILVTRVLVEIVFALPKNWEQFKRIGMLGLCSFFALLLSAPRLVGIYEFQLKKFPRLGGLPTPHFQIMGGRKWYDLTFDSFFDREVIIKHVHSDILGYYWDYSNFIGIFLLIFIVIGSVKIINVFPKKGFIALLLAVFFQFSLTRSAENVDFVRSVIPLFKQITWYWRGSAVVVILLGILAAIGLQEIFQKGKVRTRILAVAVMFLIIFEINYAQFKQMDFSPDPPIASIFREEDPPPYPALTSWAPCLLGYVFGYNNEQPEILKAGIGKGHSIRDEATVDYYNLHDVRRLASREADGGYFMTHDWPLWPKTDEQDLEKFLRYQQIIELPAYIKITNWLSLFVWILFLGGGIVLWRALRRRNIATTS